MQIFSLGRGESLEMHGGDGVTAMQICLMALNSALKHGRSGQCYVKCNLPQFTMGERSLRGPALMGRRGCVQVGRLKG